MRSIRKVRRGRRGSQLSMAYRMPSRVEFLEIRPKNSFAKINLHLHCRMRLTCPLWPQLLSTHTGHTRHSPPLRFCANWHEFEWLLGDHQGEFQHRPLFGICQHNSVRFWTAGFKLCKKNVKNSHWILVIETSSRIWRL